MTRRRQTPRDLRRRGAVVALCAGLAATAALVTAPAALAQQDANLLTVRGIDGTNREAVQLTFLYTGSPNDLKDLTIREDGAAKKVTDLTDLRKTDTRLGTVAVVDLSGSMADDGALTRTKANLTDMARNLGEGDQMAIVSFTDAPVIESTFTADVGQLEGAIDAMAAPRDAKSATYDGLKKAVALFDTRPNLQPNVLLVTDGADDASATTAVEARAAVANSGAALFAMELDHDKAVDGASIDAIIDRSGGAAFHASSADEVDKAFTELTTTMRSQYVATYASDVAQGSVNVSVAVGSNQQEASYVAGNRAQGAAVEQIASTPKAFGPSWLRGSFGGILAFVLVGVAMGLGAYSLALLATKGDSGLSAMLRPYAEDAKVESEDDGALAQTAILQRAVELTEDFAKKQGYLEKVEFKLERADWPLRAAEALFFWGVAVIVAFLLGLVTAGFMAALFLAVLTALVPKSFMNFKANRRSKKFVAQLPDTLNLLSGSLRAGYSFLQGVEAVSTEVEEPMSKELRRVITEARLGREVEDAMDSVAERMDSADFAWAVMAVRIQREVGGNLSELLLTVADTMVQRDRLRRDVASLTAEGKMSAIILGLLPIGLGAFMWLSNPVYMSPLQTTLMGNVLLGAAVVSCVIGFAWMKKTITIEI